MADSVKLRFGLFRHYGHIIKVDNQAVTMQTHDGQLKTWPRAHVTSLIFDTPPTPGLPGSLKPYSPPLYSAPNTPPQPERKTSLADSLTPDALALFRGQNSQTRYAGLYQLANRPSCWLRLPESVRSPARQLSFEVLPKWNPAQPRPEGFTLTARFLDEGGNPVGQSQPVEVAPPVELLEWFTLLTNMSGVARPQTIIWMLPPNTQQVEWLVPGEQRQLMGYIGRIQIQP